MRVQTRRQAARPTSADARQDRRLLRDSVISEPGPGTRDAGEGASWRWRTMRDVGLTGCIAQQIPNLCHEKYSLPPMLGLEMINIYNVL